MVLENKTLEDKARELLSERGVSLQDIGELVLFLQKDYIEGITLDMCIESVNAVLSKRDEGLYGIDEILALSIVNVYGSIGFTNYGYIDKVKPGILKELNSHEGPRVHTFLDDIVGAIAASAASRLAHQHPSKSHYITQ